MSFLTVASEAEYEDAVKGSRFLARVMRAATAAEASAGLDRVRAGHAGATHNCWAYRIGQELRFSDDGEPGGTAGRPMLEVLLKRDLQEVLAVVTRYYGGTKLGAGGLARAYGGTLSKALDAAGVTLVRPRLKLVVAVSYADMDAVHRLLGGWPGLEKGQVSFDAAGMRVPVSIFVQDAEPLAQALADLTRGSARTMTK